MDAARVRVSLLSGATACTGSSASETRSGRLGHDLRAHAADPDAHIKQLSQDRARGGRHPPPPDDPQSARIEENWSLSATSRSMWAPALREPRVRASPDGYDIDEVLWSQGSRTTELAQAGVGY